MAGWRRLCLVLLCTLAACGRSAQERPEEPAPEIETRAGSVEATAYFDALIDQLSIDYFALLPEMATYYGAPAKYSAGAAGRLNARSPDAERERREKAESLLAALKAVDETALDRARRLTRNTLIAQLDGALGPGRIVDYGATFGAYGSWFMPYPVVQNSGPVVDIPNLLEAQQRVTNAAEAEDYLARLLAYGPMIDDVLEALRHDAGLGAAPPDFILAKTQNVIAGFAAAPAAENVLATSFEKKLRAASVPGAEAFLARAVEIIANIVYPANARLSAYLEDLKATATHEAGIWRLPDGEALYRAMIRQMTDTDLTADEIHEIGLDEVARITAEMDAILKTEGYEDGSVAARMEALAAEARFYYPNTAEGKAQILADIATQLDKVNNLAPQWFGALPEYGVEVRAVPAFSEASAPGGYYDSPALDGSRPGVYWINLRDTAIWPKFAVPTLTYHEAVPGHHLQTALSLGQNAPLILTALYSNAFGEGWALYSEALATEMGLYADDRFGDLGRLQDELHRAIRLVVDTGLHAKKWSREKAIDYMVSVEGVHLSEAESEIERYVVWPGQALGYKIGMLKIQELRRRAAEALGAAFDIRAFHDEVLRDGAAPLPVLDAKIDAYIDAIRGGKAAATQ